jgi:hypothetical protein
MTYQLINDTGRCRPAPATVRPAQSSMPSRRAAGETLWCAVRGWLVGSFRRNAICARPHALAQPDWGNQFRRELLRVDARRIL